MYNIHPINIGCIFDPISATHDSSLHPRLAMHMHTVCKTVMPVIDKQLLGPDAGTHAD